MGLKVSNNIKKIHLRELEMLIENPSEENFLSIDERGIIDSKDPCEFFFFYSVVSFYSNKHFKLTYFVAKKEKEKELRERV